MLCRSASSDVGYVFQTDFVTKALVGLLGTDKFRVAVSADGNAFFDGFIVDNENGIVDQPRLPRFKDYTNFDNYVALDTWTRIAINNTEYNDQNAFDAGNNRFVAPVTGTYLLGASLLYKVNSSTSARMRGRLMLNGTTEIKGSFGEISGAHVTLATALWLQTMAVLDQGDTVELQGYFRAQDGYFAAGTLSPTTPQVTPSGLRKSTCGSVTTSATSPARSIMSDAGKAGSAGGA